MNTGSNITEDTVRELIRECFKRWHRSASAVKFVAADG